MNTATVTDPNVAHRRQSTEACQAKPLTPCPMSVASWRDIIQDAVAALVVSSVIILLAYLYWSA